MPAGNVLQPNTAAAASQLLWDALQKGPYPVVPAARPDFVVVCNTTEDVVTAVRWAQANGVKTYARGNGGHFAGISLVQGGLTIDLSQLKVGLNPTPIQPLTMPALFILRWATLSVGIVSGCIGVGLRCCVAAPQQYVSSRVIWGSSVCVCVLWFCSTASKCPLAPFSAFSLCTRS